jgi:hypothetical protein
VYEQLFDKQSNRRSNGFISQPIIIKTFKTKSILRKLEIYYNSFPKNYNNMPKEYFSKILSD